MRILFSIIFWILILWSNLNAQKQDNVWITGYDHSDDTSNIQFNDFGNTNFDFNYDPPKIYFDSTNYNWMSETNASICDKDGNLIAYSNGGRVWDKNHNFIMDTIDYGDYWQDNKGVGFYIFNKMIFLPLGDSVMTALYTHTVNFKASQSTKILFSTLKLNDKGNYIPIIKDRQFNEIDTFGGNVTACRHANGRDWLFFCINYKSQNIHKYLIEQNKITFIGKDTIKNGQFGQYGHCCGQTVISPRGDKLIMNTFDGFFGENHARQLIMDLDRCTGELSNPLIEYMDARSLSYGAAFSPSGRFAYFCNDSIIIQYDMDAADILLSKKYVARNNLFTWIPFPDTNPNGKVTSYFGNLNLGPDGRIYIFEAAGSSRYLSTIEYPDEEGEACTVRQNSIFTRWIGRTSPNFPPYRLMVDDGSLCDTLGIDNNPIAKYRYEADTLDHLKVRFTDLSYFRPEKWTWDFGDGTTFDGKKPYWHTFPKNGMYNVCLTVSNENSSNTSCRLVTIGGVNSYELMVNREIVSTFPNPVETEMLITISEYIPEKGEVFIYDMMGREVLKQRVYYGWNNVDMSGLPSGSYIYKVMDGRKKIGEGKVVKL